ncbi:hypothetical protein HYC85_012241 [Camellia sinensis]|uniref:PGG domain-containing protein n=1 Tax=Camellia sinensis TaxID=4442 RepID=A0A7J7HED3_CAMSI|nr:hypothetical protein HYC85_012241 [Camellia sinensis]
MDRRLYEASLSGSVADLENLEGEDQLILDRVSLTCFDQTPLHIAAWRGHSDFTRALLSRKPRLATDLNSARCSPLHLASAEGHHEIVKQLLDANDDVCEAYDEDGRTPLHLAAMKGRVEVIKLLTRAWPESNRQKLGRGGESVLHLCVKYNRLEALKTLVDELLIQNDAGFVNSEDQDGNTILHLAAALKQLDTVVYLLQVESVKEHANAKNKNGFTALDVVEDCPNRDLKQKEIRKFLRQAGAQRAQDLGTLIPESLTSEEIGTLPDSSQAILHPLPTPPTGEEIRTLWKLISWFWNKYFKADDGWFKEVRGHLITASTLTTTMAYQAGLSPPGSVWQDGPQGKNETTNVHTHIPGTSILASTGGTYATFVLFNTASLIASLSTHLLALSGFPPENKF